MYIQKKKNVLLGTLPTLLQEEIIGNLTGKIFLERFFPSFVIRVRYFILFLDSSYLKDEVYSYSNKNSRID